MAGKSIKVLVVDDSALMRRCLKEMFDAAGGFEVALARNGKDALEQVKTVDPDVVTLDVNMPEMDGLTCLSQLMVESPRPVVMVSSLTEEGATVTLEALQLGAVDFIPKPDGTVSLNLGRIRGDLLEKVRAAARVRIRRSRGLRERLKAQQHDFVRREAPRPRPFAARSGPPGLVLIGVSTGGPRALEDILPLLPAEFPWPVLVAQHMPASFTGVFARRMAGICALEVVEVAKPTPLLPGSILIAHGDADVVVERRLGRLVAAPVPELAEALWHPCVDRMVESALAHLPAQQIIGVLLTGMGYDGAAAMTALRQKGGRTIAEAESTAVVFGMPHELISRGGAEIVLPSDKVAKQVIDWV